VGIVLTAYLYTWESAAYLVLISVGVAAWILPPDGSLLVQQFADWYRLVSFAALSVFLVCVITRMKTRRMVRRVKEPSFRMTGAAAGAD
jgi:membrane protein implicated in regulation of membrane protease activity